jgi:hypothetical protein
MSKLNISVVKHNHRKTSVAVEKNDFLLHYGYTKALTANRFSRSCFVYNPKTVTKVVNRGHYSNKLKTSTQTEENKRKVALDMKLWLTSDLATFIREKYWNNIHTV